MEHQAWQKYSKIKCCLYHIRMYMTGLKFLLYRLYGEVNRGWKHIRSRFSWPYISCVAQNICGSLFLRIGDFFVLRELIFTTRTDWSTQYPALTIFSFLLSTCNRNAYFKKILRCASVFLCIPLCFWTKKTSCKRRYVFYWGKGGPRLRRGGSLVHFWQIVEGQTCFIPNRGRVTVFLARKKLLHVASILHIQEKLPVKINLNYLRMSKNLYVKKLSSPN